MRAVSRLSAQIDAKQTGGRFIMITTSYFAGKAPASRKVCIALGRPRYFRKGGLHIKQLAPSNPRATNWQDLYRLDLRTRFPKGRGLRELLSQIEKAVPNPVLCCYEKDIIECHRGILALYVQDWIGLEIPEWRPGL